MNDDESETRTRAQRDAALQEGISAFNQHIRNLNKMTRRIHSTSARANADPNELQDCVNEYEAIFEELSTVYDQIRELSFDSPPQKVVDSFERVDAESCKFLAETSSRIRSIHEQERLDRSHSHERQLFETQARSQSDQSENISKLCSQMVLGRLPAPEPEIFSGDPLKFTAWSNSFNALITSRSIPESECIFYLNKYLSGEAKSCVEGFLDQCTPEAYHNALALLNDRFGSDFVVANAFRQKLRKWPRIQNDDFVGLRKFSDYLCQVETAKLRNKSLFVLDDEQENRSLLFKIPSFCHSRWSRKVAQSMEEGQSYPTFSEFCKFIRIEAAVVNNPITCIKSQSGFNQGYRAQQGGQGQGYNSQSFSNRPRFSHAVTSPPAFNQGSDSCFYYNQPHFLSDCHGFISLSRDERRNFCKSQRLCFGCLCHGHANTDCRKRMPCATCNWMPGATCGSPPTAAESRATGRGARRRRSN